MHPLRSNFEAEHGCLVFLPPCPTLENFIVRQNLIFFFAQRHVTVSHVNSPSPLENFRFSIGTDGMRNWGSLARARWAENAPYFPVFLAPIMKTSCWFPQSSDFFSSWSQSRAVLCCSVLLRPAPGSQ
jgi:hypothetical protein